MKPEDMVFELREDFEERDGKGLLVYGSKCFWRGSGDQVKKKYHNMKVSEQRKVTDPKHFLMRTK